MSLEPAQEWEFRVSVECQRVKEEGEEETDGQQESGVHIKEESEWTGDVDWSLDRDVKEESAPLDLRVGHRVEGDLVLGPEGPQPPDSAFAQPTRAGSPPREGPGGSVSPGQAAGQRHLDVDRQTHTRPSQKLLEHSHTRTGDQACTCEACLSGDGECGARHASLQERDYAQASAHHTCGRSPRREAPAPGRAAGRDEPRPSGEQRPPRNKPYSCEVCLKQFTNLSGLKKHRRIHTREKPYSCSVCLKQFTNLSGLKKHRRIHTGEKPYSCDLCRKQFMYQCSLKQHRRIHTGEKPYSCGVCRKQFMYESSLKQHRRIHTVVKLVKPYSCNVCMKQFTQKAYLKQHRRIHTGEKPYTCDLCMKQFMNQSYLKQHKRIHTGEKPYSCDVCTKQFTLKVSLITHRRTHTGEKPYSCDVCMKQFAQKNAVARHKRTHTGEKPYSCDVCMKQFAHQNNAVRHKRTHSGEERPFS